MIISSNQLATVKLKICIVCLPIIYWSGSSKLKFQTNKFNPLPFVQFDGLEWPSIARLELPNRKMECEMFA